MERAQLEIPRAAGRNLKLPGAADRNLKFRAVAGSDGTELEFPGGSGLNLKSLAAPDSTGSPGRRRTELEVLGGAGLNLKSRVQLTTWIYRRYTDDILRPGGRRTQLEFPGGAGGAGLNLKPQAVRAARDSRPAELELRANRFASQAARAPSHVIREGM